MRSFSGGNNCACRATRSSGSGANGKRCSAQPTRQAPLPESSGCGSSANANGVAVPCALRLRAKTSESASRQRFAASAVRQARFNGARFDRATFGPGAGPVITGHSFLGLSTPGPAVDRSAEPDALRPSPNVDYLLDDEEEPKRGWGKLVFIVVALALAVGMGYLHFKQAGFDGLIAGDKKPVATKPTSDAPQNPDSGPAAAPATPNSAPPSAGVSNNGTAPATGSGAMTPAQPASQRPHSPLHLRPLPRLRCPHLLRKPLPLRHRLLLLRNPLLLQTALLKRFRRKLSLSIPTCLPGLRPRAFWSRPASGSDGWGAARAESRQSPHL